MIERKKYLELLMARNEHYPVVALLGPRQIGKTTLAQQFMAGRAARYFDLESAATQDLMRQPAAVLEPLTGLVVIDEAQRMPELFPLLRVWADRRPLPARFLILGSVSPWLMKGVTESLAGAGVVRGCGRAGAGGGRRGAASAAVVAGRFSRAVSGRDGRSGAAVAGGHGAHGD